MKKILFALVLGLSLFAAVPREITLETKKINDAVHWTPERIEVTAGESIKLTAKHDLDGGFDFHGLFIPVLKISKQVDRHKPLSFELSIPTDLKAGDYPIGCHFHSKHVGAHLIVNDKK